MNQEKALLSLMQLSDPGAEEAVATALRCLALNEQTGKVQNSILGAHGILQDSTVDKLFVAGYVNRHCKEAPRYRLLDASNFIWRSPWSTSFFDQNGNQWPDPPSPPAMMSKDDILFESEINSVYARHIRQYHALHAVGSVYMDPQDTGVQMIRDSSSTFDLDLTFHSIIDLSVLPACKDDWQGTLTLTQRVTILPLDAKSSGEGIYNVVEVSSNLHHAGLRSPSLSTPSATSPYVLKEAGELRKMEPRRQMEVPRRSDANTTNKLKLTHRASREFTTHILTQKAMSKLPAERLISDLSEYLLIEANRLAKAWSYVAYKRLFLYQPMPRVSVEAARSVEPM